MSFEVFIDKFAGDLRKSGLEFRVIKGLVTAAECYQNQYLRTFSDIDIIIKPNSLETVNRILSDNNFKICEDLYTHFPDNIIKKYNFARHYIHKSKTIAIDVHLNLSGRLHPFQFDIADFMKHSKKSTDR